MEFDKTKPIFNMLCGLPGAGKLKFANMSLQDSNIIHVNTIKRESVRPDGSVNKSRVYEIMINNIKESLISGQDTTLVDCNIARSVREGILKNIESIDCTKVCTIVYNSIETCKSRLDARVSRTHETDTVDEMLRKFETPSKFEGFDYIVCMSLTTDLENASDVIVSLDTFDQENSHHSLTLGQHLLKTSEYVAEKAPDDIHLQLAAKLHDCGKPYTKEWDEAKSEFRYFSHHNVGAYLALGYAFPEYETEIRPIELSRLICLHMNPYFWKHTDNPEATALKYKNRWGTELYGRIMLLHEADVAAH